MPVPNIDQLLEIKKSIAASTDLINEINREKERQQKARDADLHAISEHTSHIKKSVDDVNARVDLLNTQLDGVAVKMDLADEANAKAARKAQNTAYVSIGIAAVSMIAAIVSAIISLIK